MEVGEGLQKREEGGEEREVKFRITWSVDLVSPLGKRICNPTSSLWKLLSTTMPVFHTGVHASISTEYSFISVEYLTLLSQRCVTLTLAPAKHLQFGTNDAMVNNFYTCILRAHISFNHMIA